MLITSLLELHIRTTQSAVPSVFIMQSEQLYKRKFLKKPFDSFLLRYDYKALFFRNGVFFCPESFSRRKKSGYSSGTYASEPVSVFCISVILFDYQNVIQLYVQPAWIRYYKYVRSVAGEQGDCAAYLRRGNSAGIFSRGGKKSFCRSSVCFADFNSAEHLSWKIQRGRNLTGICTSGSVDCHNYNRRKYYMEESCKASCYSGRMIWA